MSGPSSEQRVSAEAVKGAGKEEEDFFRALTVSVLPLKPFTGCDGKKYAFPVGWQARRAEARAGAFSLRYNGKS